MEKSEIKEVKPVTTKKSTAKKTTTKKTPAKKTTAAKAVAPKATTTAKKTATKKTVTKKATPKKATTKKTNSINCYIQYGSVEISETEVEKRVKEVWTKQLKKKVADMNEVKIYIKPEEMRAYYVIDEDFTGYIEL